MPALGVEGLSLSLVFALFLWGIIVERFTDLLLFCESVLRLVFFLDLVFTWGREAGAPTAPRIEVGVSLFLFGVLLVASRLPQSALGELVAALLPARGFRPCRSGWRSPPEPR